MMTKTIELEKSLNETRIPMEETPWQNYEDLFSSMTEMSLKDLFSWNKESEKKLKVAENNLKTAKDIFKKKDDSDPVQKKEAYKEFKRKYQYFQRIKEFKEAYQGAVSYFLRSDSFFFCTHEDGDVEHLIKKYASVNHLQITDSQIIW